MAFLLYRPLWFCFITCFPMYGRFVLAALMLLVGAASFLPAAAQDTTRTLVVGVKEAPPFAIQQPDGTWGGISIILWEQVAEELDLPYEWQERDLQGLLEGVEDGSLDAAVAALTVTAEREEGMDFSHPFYASGLGIAVRVEEGERWLSVIRGFLSMAFLKVVGVLVLLLLLVGLVIWMVERRHNPEHFGGSPAQGIGSGFWWSAVTMTTVGYGDKAPVTAVGRIVGLIWMFTAIIIISSFTAAIASSLTLSQFSHAVEEPGDLRNVQVGTVPNSTSAEHLHAQHISARLYDSPAAALAALAAGEIEAFVYDAPILRYLVNSGDGASVEVLPGTFQEQYYAIAFPSGSALLEPVNRSLLEQTDAPAWQDVLYRYLGK